LRLAAPRSQGGARVEIFHILAYYHHGVVVLHGCGMSLERSFGFLVHDVARLFARRFNERALHVLGLTRTQCRLLGYLARNEGINQAGLADLLEIKPMTLVRQIDRMEVDGWIERRLDPRDRRARRLVLTDKARPIVAGIAGLSNEVRREAFTGFAAGEGADLIDLLRRVHVNLTAQIPAPAAGERTRSGTSMRSAGQPAPIAAALAVAGGRP
jgi:MarR family transcriptional regulator, transcriptional regulator for hemolysin